MTNMELVCGQTLLVDGPASVYILTGKVEVIGAELVPPIRLRVRKERRMPIEAVERTSLSINIEKNGSALETTRKGIPELWSRASEKVLGLRKATVVILGGGDSGKTTFSTYLANKAVRRKLCVAIIDGDIGQANLGPPTTISYGFVKTTLLDLFSVRPEKSYFVGLTSPSSAPERVLAGLRILKDKASETDLDLVIVDTDGWIQGESAHTYKGNLINEVKADFVVGLQTEDELEPILKFLKAQNVIRIPAAETVRPRNREIRQLLRWQGYSKYLRDSVNRVLDLREIKIEYSFFGTGQALSVSRKMVLENYLGCPVRYCEEAPTFLYLVLDKKFCNLVREIPNRFNGKDIHVFLEGDVQGLLLGLLDHNRRFLGIGIVQNIDFKKRKMKVLTVVKDRISVIQAGQVKLLHGEEVSTTGPCL
jgi:polynucleotide 5'-hydroxyl-kinase GRC3/NOL9